MSKLAKRALGYAKANNYYKIGKIKKCLKLLDKRMEKLYKELGVSVCPFCGSTDTDWDYDDDEYTCDRFMCCNVCGECYDDNRYLNALAEIESYDWFDGIALAVWEHDFNPPKTYSWFKMCDEEMDRMIEELSK